MTTVLNFAPALADYTDELLENIDYLILNEVEIEQFSKLSKLNDDNEIEKACASLLVKYSALVGVIVTIGEKGVIYSDRLNGNKTTHVPCKKVNVVDSTVRKAFAVA